MAEETHNTEVVETTAETVEEGTSAPETKPSQGLADLDFLAQQRSTVREEQKSVEAMKAEVARMKAEIESKQVEFERAQKAFQYDPLGTMEKLGIDQAKHRNWPGNYKSK